MGARVWARKLWINKEAVTSVTGWSDRTIRWKVQLGALSSRNSSNGKKRGRSSSEYALSSLPVEAQLKSSSSRCCQGHAARLWRFVRIRTNLTCLPLCRRSPNPSVSTFLRNRTHRPEAPGSHCAAREFSSRSRGPPHISYERRSRRAKHDLAGQLPRRSAPRQRPHSLELVCTVPPTRLCGLVDRVRSDKENPVPRSPSRCPRIRGEQVSG